MKTCFVIQRFDDGVYDKRYRETFAPAIINGGAQPIRADEVLGTRPVVEKIEQGLRAASIAFAEVSEDNPNVFLELGYALALFVPTIIVCDKLRRSALPFDIAHRPITFYTTEAQSDYEIIANKITKGVTAALNESQPRGDLDGTNNSNITMDAVKHACLVSLLDQGLRSPLGASLWQIQRDTASSGISERMDVVAIASLLQEGLATRQDQEDRDGDLYSSFRLSPDGQKYILHSYSDIMQNEREKLIASRHDKSATKSGFALDEDIPF